VGGYWSDSLAINNLLFECEYLYGSFRSALQSYLTASSLGSSRPKPVSPYKL